jgi:ankyrin repeat protein
VLCAAQGGVSAALLHTLLAAKCTASESPNAGGSTPALVAMGRGNVATLAALLQAKAAPDTPRPADGATALLAALQLGSAEAVKLLAAHKASVNGVTRYVRLRRLLLPVQCVCVCDLVLVCERARHRKR